jgi:hypothetical protein
LTPHYPPLCSTLPHSHSKYALSLVDVKQKNALGIKKFPSGQKAFGLGIKERGED